MLFELPNYLVIEGQGVGEFVDGDQSLLYVEVYAGLPPLKYVSVRGSLFGSAVLALTLAVLARLPVAPLSSKQLAVV